MAAENHVGYFDRSLPVSTTVVSLEIPAGTTPVRAVLQPTVGAIIFRYSGSDPVNNTSGGFYLATNEETILEGVDNIKNLRMVRSSTTDAVVYYTLERE